MAEAFLGELAGDRYQPESAGLEPGKLNPLILEVMQEVGLDLSRQETHSVFQYLKEGRSYDFVIAVCSTEAEERCPIFPGNARRYHWPFDDPGQIEGSHQEKLGQVRMIRDQIKEKIQSFIADA